MKLLPSEAGVVNRTVICMDNEVGMTIRTKSITEDKEVIECLPITEETIDYVKHLLDICLEARLRAKDAGSPDGLEDTCTKDLFEEEG